MPILYNVVSKKPELLDGPELQAALANGTHAYQTGEMVKVTSPEGVKGTVPSENIQEAIKSGFQAETPSQAVINQYVEDNKGLKGALKVGLGQFADEALMGLPELTLNHTQSSFEVAKREALKKEHDVANTIGGVGGFGGSLFVGGPLFKAGTAAYTKTAGLLAEKIVQASAEEIGKRTALEAAKGLLKKTGVEAAGRAAEGAVIAAPHAITEAMLGDPEAAGESLLAGVGIGALFGGATPLGKELFGLAKKVSGNATELKKAAVSKIGKVFSGVNEDDILHYIDNNDRANATFKEYSELGGGNAIEGLKNEIDDVVGGITEKVEIARANEFKLKNELDQAYNIEKQRLLQTRPPENLAKDIMGALENEKSVLGSLSAQADDALERSGLTFQKQDMLGLLDKIGKSIGVGRGKAKALISDEAVAAVNKLKAQRDRIAESLPEQITASELRAILQDVRKDIKWNQAAGEFNDTLNKARTEFQKGISEVLKDQVPEYKFYMKRMSGLSQTLEKMSKAFGEEGKAVGALNSILSPKGTVNAKLLQEFDALTGQNFTGQLKEFIDAKAKLDLAKVKDIRGDLLPELKKQYDLTAGELESWKAWQDELKRLGPNQTQNLLRNQGFKNPSIENRKALEFLSQMTGKDYLEIIKDVNVVNQFSKEYTSGSRRTLLGSVIGSVAGGPFGTAIGGAAGASADVYGGRILKAMIDASKEKSGLLFAEKAMGEIGRKLDTIPTAMENLGKKVKASSASISAINRLFGDDSASQSTTQRAKKLEDFSKQATKWVSNPEEAMKKMQELTYAVSNGGAPQIGAVAQSKFHTALNYIFEEMPKPPRPTSPFAKQYPWKPSDQQLSAFEQKTSVVLDPFVVFDELQKGTLTRNHIDALKKVYPVIYKNMKMRMQDTVLKGVKPVSFNTRAKLSMIMEAPMDIAFTPSKMLSYQENWSGPDETVDEDNQKEVNIAEDMQSDVDKIMG